uniref:Disease resistance N-terminal domain-containing protein n=1 Tax=Triticum urartu TaxID=4572 RepID=A0A8R7P8Z2_TRIUA
MEVVKSAVVGELVSRFISFLMNKYHSNNHAQSEKVVERLQRLLMRVSTVVEEADARYITNSAMQLQLKMLSEAMYGGYSALDTLRHRTIQDSAGFDEVDVNACLVDHTMCIFTLKISCSADTQKLLSFFLQHNNPPGDHAPAVLPIIGGAAIGKKTLVAHVCSDERFRSRFSYILHLNGNSLLKILDHGRTMEGMILVVIEFAADVGDDDWKKLHSLLITMGRGIKIIIVSKLKRLARFGSLNRFS